MEGGCIIRASSRREQRKEATRRRLVESADRLFREGGFETTTVEAIADAADVAKGTFFNYFANKEAVLVAILYNRIEEAVADELPDAGSTVQRIYALLDHVRAALAPYCRMLPHLMMHTILPRRPKLYAGEQGRRQPLMSAVARLLEEGGSRGEVRPDIQTELGARFIVIFFFHTLFESCLLPTGQPFTERLEAGMEILFHGLLQDGANEAAR